MQFLSGRPYNIFAGERLVKVYCVIPIFPEDDTLSMSLIDLTAAQFGHSTGDNVAT